jgi:hypothetical protein
LVLDDDLYDNIFCVIGARPKAIPVDLQKDCGQGEGDALVAIDEGVVSSPTLEQSRRLLGKPFIVPGLRPIERTCENARISNTFFVRARQAPCDGPVALMWLGWMIRQARRKWTAAEKRALVDEARSRLEAGETMRRVCNELHLGEGSLRLWMQQHPKPTLMLAPVRVAPPETGAGLAMVTPQGFRIEGLDLGTTLWLLERMPC